MLHPLLVELRRYLGPNTSCSLCGGEVFTVALENPQYKVDLSAKEVKEPSLGSEDIEAVRCDNCGAVL